MALTLVCMVWYGEVMKLASKDVARFWSKVDKSAGSTACWLWTAYRDYDGYGRLKVGGTSIVVTHIALFLVGKLRPSLEYKACHTCDNPPCVQPLHLFWGTQLDNERDKMRKDRHQYGAKHWAVTITQEQAMDIIRSIRNGGMNVFIAKRIGISVHIVRDIRRNKTWKHLSRNV